MPELVSWYVTRAAFVERVQDSRDIGAFRSALISRGLAFDGRDEQAPARPGQHPRHSTGMGMARAVGRDAGVRVHLTIQLGDQQER